jgi:uncharacterized integral membrane protein (TIGR00698 family)
MNSGTSLIRRAAPGMGMTLIIALIAFLASSMHPSFDSLVIAVIFGMLVVNMFDDRKMIEEGVELALKIFLPLGIALYGFQLKVTDVPTNVLPGVLVVFALMFSVSYFISRGIGLDKPLSVLISTGLSVCGASAIVVIAPIIGARKEDTSISVLSVIAVGLTGMLAYRVIAGMGDINVGQYAFLTGATLPMLGQVKVASAAMGSESLNMALRFKLVRISSLALVAVAGLIFSGRQGGRKRVPWFMVAFFAFAIAVNTSSFAASLSEMVRPASKVSLSLALAAIGLSINFDSVTEKGMGPLLSAFLAWGIIALTVYLALSTVIQ